MKLTRALIIAPALLVSLVALAEGIFDTSFYSSRFMEEVSDVFVEVKVPMAKEITEVKMKLPRVQAVEMSLANSLNGKWEVIRVLDDKLKPVYDKFTNYDDQKSQIIVDMSLVQKSTIKINNSEDQVYKISSYNKVGKIALFKKFGTGYEILEARKIVEKKVVNKSSEAKEEKKSLSKIEKRLESNQELVLFSALNPSVTRDVLKGNKISGSVYLSGNQVIFSNLALHIGGDKETESLSFEAEVDGDTGHLNYNNEIQGIVSVVGNDEVRVRFSTGPLANAMLNFKVASEVEDNVAEENLEPAREEVEVAEEKTEDDTQARETASSDEEDYEFEGEEEFSDEQRDVEEVGYDF